MRQLRAALVAAFVFLLPSAAGATPDRETRCLAQAVYREARGEPLAGQRAVAEVVLNRVQQLHRGADTICRVVRDPGQFPWASRRWKAPREADAWAMAVHVATGVQTGALPRLLPRDTLFFHDKRLRPAWAKAAKAPARVIGGHVFLRLP